MPKVLVLVVVAAAVAVGAGLALPADAIKVSGTSLNATQLGNELDAINHSGPWQCYLQAKAYVDSQGQSPAPGVPGVAAKTTWNNRAAVGWADTRTFQLAQIQFVEAHLPSAFSPVSLAKARGSLANAIFDKQAQAYSAGQNSQSPYSCSASSSGVATLKSVPAWFADEQVKAQAAYLGMAALLANPIPESGAGLARWYAAHRHLFGTCVAVIVPSASASATEIAAKIDAGMSIAEAARRYSVDAATKQVGGFVGCFTPSMQAFPTVIKDLGRSRAGHVNVVTAPSGQVFLIGRIPNRLALLLGAVKAQAHASNVQSVQLLSIAVMRNAGASVDPALGTWIPGTLGGTIYPPPAPKPGDTTNPTANVPPSSVYAPGSTGGSSSP